MKLKELQKQLVENKLDACLFLSTDSSFFYFVGQKINNSMVLIPKKGKPILFINNLEQVKVKMKKVTYKDPYKDLKNFISKKKIKAIGINESFISVMHKRKLAKIAKVKDLGNIVYDLRLRKTKQEITKIKKACFLTEKVFKKIVRNFNFRTEGDLKKFIKKEAIELDCGLSFEPIIASAKNSGLKPHYSGNSRIKKGFLIVDMGLKYEGYCADITRTLYIGTPSKKELDFYNEILRIQKKVVDMVKAGIKAKELELFVRKEMGKDEKFFVHSLGHGLGINVHEAPGINSKSDIVLKEGMVITIEPGIYKKQGIRIEDDVLVTAKGRILLSKFPKELIIIPKK